MIVTLFITDLHVFYAHYNFVLTALGKVDWVNGLRIDMVMQLRHLTEAIQGINTNGFFKKLQKLNCCIYTKKLAMYLKFSGIL